MEDDLFCSLQCTVTNFNIYNTEEHFQKDMIFFCGTDEPEGGYNTERTHFPDGFHPSKHREAP